MVTVEFKERASAVLSPSKLPCLGQTATVNVSEGCMHGCCYCYARGYSSYPGQKRVWVYKNLPEKIAAELSRKRNRPRRVYFCPSSDAFQPSPLVLDISLAAMEVLLRQRVQVAFVTKGVIPEPFLLLFARYPEYVIPRIGITTLDEQISRTLEPRAATPTERLANIDRLSELGIPVMARLDPLILDLTDTPENLNAIFTALAARSVKHIAASYLFLRPTILEPITDALQTIGYDVSRYYSHSIQHSAGTNDLMRGSQMLPLAQRQARLTRLTELAESHGLQTHVCRCKNPDIPTTTNCLIAGQPLPQTQTDLPLFE